MKSPNARSGLACLFVLMLSTIPLLAAEPDQTGLSLYSKLSPENDWPWWRGPTRNGHAALAAPTQLSESDNLLWKVPVPGRGHSSPTVIGDRVFLTTANEGQQTHYALAFDRTTGKNVWQKELNKGAFPTGNHPKNTEATPTIGSNGELLFTTFYHHDQVELLALDFDGNVVWKKNAGRFRPRKFEYGYAPSPLIYRTSVILAAEFDGDSFLASFDAKTGKEEWRTPRPNNITFSSPVVAHVAGQDQLLISGAEKVASYNPQTGKPLWSVSGTTNATCGTMVWDDDTVFASGGYPKAETIAVKADGSKKVLWKNNQKCYEQSMLAVGGYVYGLTDQGVLFCWRATDGKEMWKQRLSGPVSASPVLAGGYIYQADEMGKLYVFKPNPQKYEQVAANQVGNDSFASPAICGGQVFLRVADSQGGKRQEYLYCFGSKN